MKALNSSERPGAIIVGASSGLGRELALVLLKEGWRVGVAARRIEKLQELQEMYPAQVEYAVVDVTVPEAASRLQILIEKVGHVGLYVHASGIGKQNPMLDKTIEETTIRTNVLGFTSLVLTAFDYFAQSPQGGHIAVISSIAGTKGLGVSPSYSATKAYNNIYIEALEQLAGLRQLPITFTDIRPGFVDTALLDDTHHYPMLMRPDRVAHAMWKAIRRRRRVAVIDVRYRLLVFFWRLIPRWIWARLPIRN